MTIIRNAIFLDLDGVLNTKRHLEYLYRMGLPDRDQYEHLFDPECVANLEVLIQETGAKIIISSSWRLKGLDYIKEMWKSRGMKGEIIGVTPHIILNVDYRCPRGMEIFVWMDHRKETLEIKNYVIIDDQNNMLFEHRHNFVQTTWQNGFDKPELEQALKILNR